MGKFLVRREPNCVLTIKPQKKRKKDARRRKSPVPLSHLQSSMLISAVSESHCVQLFHQCCIFISHAALRLMVKAVKMKRLPN